MAQVAYLQEAARRLGSSIVVIYRDEGISGPGAAPSAATMIGHADLAYTVCPFAP